MSTPTQLASDDEVPEVPETADAGGVALGRRSRSSSHDAACRSRAVSRLQSWGEGPNTSMSTPRELVTWREVKAKSKRTLCQIRYSLIGHALNSVLSV